MIAIIIAVTAMFYILICKVHYDVLMKTKFEKHWEKETKADYDNRVFYYKFALRNCYIVWCALSLITLPFSVLNLISKKITNRIVKN
jgi:hypothetical protein